MPPRRDECMNGHPMSGDNLYVSPKGVRQCIACRNARCRKHYEANKQQYIDRVVERRASGLVDRSAEGRRYYEKNKDRVRAMNDRWRAANPERVRDIRENRRARQRDAFIEHVDRKLMWAIHLGMCGICFRSVALEEMEMDHIVPLSRGGTHEYRNCQPAHMTCNRRKFNKVVT